MPKLAEAIPFIYFPCALQVFHPVPLHNLPGYAHRYSKTQAMDIIGPLNHTRPLLEYAYEDSTVDAGRQGSSVLTTRTMRVIDTRARKGWHPPSKRGRVLLMPLTLPQNFPYFSHSGVGSLRQCAAEKFSRIFILLGRMWKRGGRRV